ncbi:hypothetical protein TREMEDRAFT_63107 [Tremella mesenterica DSM 1558]|uniref:uncharacterized protein n=1 Tax=Tremella mesenterica (strain ATCC 24925 / CBS 8224 / DSM 1558 / NBRC 9311 / NRRL Y-6157 / RJB 2259-6 / UBC 559-6) TaxID=578456 RepID=UPI0003F499FF|nr:uncharacterized protein TREMEDRAFT_63107 [Tremella mesenterica DSM 1558]EIW68642.1 hypothetical protein TREMEDRAFT_63107 [Tremella mesenterica DSM 1558]
MKEKKEERGTKCRRDLVLRLSINRKKRVDPVELLSSSSIHFKRSEKRERRKLGCLDLELLIFPYGSARASLGRELCAVGRVGLGVGVERLEGVRGRYNGGTGFESSKGSSSFWERELGWADEDVDRVEICSREEGERGKEGESFVAVLIMWRKSMACSHSTR